MFQTAAQNGEHYYIRAATNISSEDEDSQASAELQILTFTSVVSLLNQAWPLLYHLFAVIATNQLQCAMLESGLTDRIVVHGDGRGDLLIVAKVPPRKNRLYYFLFLTNQAV